MPVEESTAGRLSLATARPVVGRRFPEASMTFRKGPFRLALIALIAFLAGAPGVAAQTWVPTDDLAAPRWHHAAFLLPNGKVLVAGEGNTGAAPPSFTTQVFDPSTATWAPGPSPSLVHQDSVAVRMADG